MQTDSSAFINTEYIKKCLATDLILLWLMGAQWSVEECLPRDRGAAGSSLTGVTALCP